MGEGARMKEGEGGGVGEGKGKESGRGRGGKGEGEGKRTEKRATYLRKRLRVYANVDRCSLRRPSRNANESPLICQWLNT